MSVPEHAWHLLRTPKGSRDTNQAISHVLVLFALGTCYAIELFKFYQAPSIVSVRHSTFGHLVLGHAFSWQNLVAYTLGVFGSVGIEYLVRVLGE